MSTETPASIRIDRLLVYLRFARTRSVAQTMIKQHALRRNRKHVLRPSENVSTGDVLTLMVGNEVRILEVVSLPTRRAAPALAKSHYRELDRAELRRKALGTNQKSPSAKPE